MSQQVTIKSSYLSRRPASYSLMVSFSTLLLIALVSQAAWRHQNILDAFVAVPEMILTRHEWWRAFTAVLIHGDLQHLLSNAYMLGILGIAAYGYFGITVYPLTTFILAGLTNLVVMPTYEPQTRLLGASGWVYLVAGFWLVLFVLSARQYSVFMRLLRAAGVSLVTLFPSTFEPQISYRTHFVGFVVGTVYGIIYFNLHRKQIRSYEVQVEEESEPEEFLVVTGGEQNH